MGWLPAPITVESAVPHGCPFSPLAFILICIIETFLLSQFVYVMQALIAPPDFLIQVNTLLFRFLSKNKNSKAFEKAEVKRVVMCSSYRQCVFHQQVLQRKFELLMIVHVLNSKCIGEQIYIAFVLCRFGV